MSPTTLRKLSLTAMGAALALTVAAADAEAGQRNRNFQWTGNNGLNGSTTGTIINQPGFFSRQFNGEASNGATWQRGGTGYFDQSGGTWQRRAQFVGANGQVFNHTGRLTCIAQNGCSGNDQWVNANGQSWSRNRTLENLGDGQWAGTTVFNGPNGQSRGFQYEFEVDLPD